MRTVIYDPYLKETKSREMGAELVSFERLLAESDFISLHAPLNEKTRHLFGEAAFSKMKRTAYIINTARGGLIDEQALLAALDAGKIAGRRWMCLESEIAVTPVRTALVNHPKVIVTPHTAWLSEESRDVVAREGCGASAGWSEGRETVRPGELEVGQTSKRSDEKSQELDRS